MTNHVTPQTATRLKQAGFKQPVPASGQVWYLDDEAAIVLAVHSNGVSYCRGNCNYFERTDIFLSLFVYAPTAPDILRELGGNYTLSFLGKVSTCTNTSLPAPGLLKMENIYYHENPAEACALALEAKQKQP